MYQRMYYARPVRENRKKSYRVLAMVMVPVVVVMSYFAAISISIMRDDTVQKPGVTASAVRK